MLKQFVTCPVEELYLNILDEGSVSRVGINSGLIVDPAIFPPASLVPTKSVRLLGTMQNAPLVLSAEAAYGVPVEVAPPNIVMVDRQVLDIRNVVVHTRNMHRSMPDHHPLRYRVVDEAEKYAFGLTYNCISDKVGKKPYNFSDSDIDLAVDTKYTDGALDNHAMSDLFTCEHVVDLCALLIDPRFHMGSLGRFGYSTLCRTLGFGSLELACELVRKIMSLHGTGPLPCSGIEVRKLFQKATGFAGNAIGLPHQIFGIRVLYDILSVPLDTLGVSLRNVNKTKMFRDSEIVRQRLHSIIDEWLSRIYQDEWAPDEYDPAMFDVDMEDGDEEDD